jgi:hypothetical protein
MRLSVLFLFAFLACVLQSGIAQQSGIQASNKDSNTKAPTPKVQQAAPLDLKDGQFYCVINGKPYLINSASATLRRISNGDIQLSLSNDRFVKFTFYNPKDSTTIPLTSGSRDAIIRYEDPHSMQEGMPVEGMVTLTTLNKQTRTISGKFEFVLVIAGDQLNPTRKVQVSQGEFKNVPIEIR